MTEKNLDPKNGFPIPNANEATQYRRAEKGWRYRDQERAWTQYIWGLIVTSQSIMLGIFAIIATRPNVPVSQCQLIAVVVITIVELFIFIWRSSVRRSIDRMWAAHFEGLVKACEDQTGYDNDKYDRETKEAELEWAKTVSRFDSFGIFCFAITAMILLCAVWCSG